MSPGDLHSMIKEYPFTPFRITMNSGDQFIVDNPEHILITGTSAYLGLNADPETGIPARSKILSMINICSAERINDRQIPKRRPRRQK